MSYLQELASKKRYTTKNLTPQPRVVEAQLTGQQQAVLTATGTTKVNAYAGTGKTSSLCALAADRSTTKCLYLAFNKSAQLEASARFGPNTRCVTVHGLAFAKFGKKFAHKIGPLRNFDVLRKANLSYNWLLAELVSETIRAWCVSDLQQFPKQAINIGGSIVTHRQAEQVAQIAEELWKKMCDPNDDFPMTHDGYLKLYQLSKPRIACDLLMLDEAQDTNPVTWAIVKAQPCPIVVVGDRYQGIYGFRGAINAMELVQADSEFPLTQSFRFGPRVAHLATKLLETYHGESIPLEGLGPDTQIALPPKDAAYTLLARTNAEIFLQAVLALQTSKTIGFVGGVSSYGFEKIIDVNHLRNKEHRRIKDIFIRGMPSFDSYVDYAKESHDLEAKRLIHAVLTYGDEVEQIVAKIYSFAENDIHKASIVLSTAHKSKGLSIDHVVLANDFYDIILEGAPLTGDPLIQSEINLLYVAITRVKKTLSINNSTLSFIEAVNATDILHKSYDCAIINSPSTQITLF